MGGKGLVLGKGTSKHRSANGKRHKPIKIPPERTTDPKRSFTLHWLITS